MAIDLQESLESRKSPNLILEQNIKGSRKISNYLVGSMLTIGGVGFSLASISSYLGKDLLPLGQPSTLIFVPQGLIMGLYGIAASFVAIYLWYLIRVDFGTGFNRFNKSSGTLSISRRGYFKEIMIEIPLKEIKAIKLDVKDGFNARRRLTLRIQGRKDLPISRPGETLALIELEQQGAELARFLDINLEGI